MCGISGIFEYGRRKKPNRGDLMLMLNTIRHRGPDDSGTLVTDHVAIGMQRLSIIDLAGGRQPVSNEDGTVSVVFNGEIYNYRELRQQLLSRGHTLATASDTEVIVHLYEEMGADCVQALRGMFAFALYDKTKQRLLVARDRLGIKPLYYREEKGTLLFGSELKALLAHPDVAASLNLQGLSYYLSMRYVPAPYTMFEGISSLPPGHLMICDASGISLRRYWQLYLSADAECDKSENVLEEKLESLLLESVGCHLESDVPFGAFLSGGIDSSLIVALMTELMSIPVKTFSVGFGGSAEKYSELPYARIVARHLKTDHYEVMITPSDVMDLSEKVIWHLDQPIGDKAAVPNYMVARLASSQVKMVLTGEGGDELFAGYARYAGEMIAPFFQAMPEAGRNCALGLVERLPMLRRSKVAMSALCQSDELARMAAWFPLFHRRHKAALCDGGALSSVTDPYATEILGSQLSLTNAKDSLSRMLFLDTKLWLPDDLLLRGDKTSMAASIEARVPLLDHHVVEFAASLPSRLKLKGFTRKYLLRKVAQKWLPREIIERKKKGFPVPLALWFRSECRSFVHDLLSNETLRRRGLFNVAFVQLLVHEHDSGIADHADTLWGLISFELWCRSFLDTAPAVKESSAPAACLVTESTARAHACA